MPWDARLGAALGWESLSYPTTPCPWAQALECQPSPATACMWPQCYSKKSPSWQRLRSLCQQILTTPGRGKGTLPP